jgi:hypothetical protein
MFCASKEVLVKVLTPVPVWWHKFQALERSALVVMMCSVLHAVLEVGSTTQGN